MNNFLKVIFLLTLSLGQLEGRLTMDAHAFAEQNGKPKLKPPQLSKHPPLNGKPYVLGFLRNQLGNQMFEVAAAYSLALDHEAVAVFPDLVELSEWRLNENYHYVFWRLNPTRPKLHPEKHHSYHGIPYEPIPYHPNMEVSGIFHSEKYFAHHKEEILNLFAPHPSIRKHIHQLHPWLSKTPNTVAVHVRAYWPVFPGGYKDGYGILPFMGFDWFKKAILTFPKNSLFVVFSNNMEWCKENFKNIKRRFKFIEGQEHYIDLYMMSMCKHNIISNSSYSWWGAYLNKNPNKIVVAPKQWFEPHTKMKTHDICPEGWVVLE